MITEDYVSFETAKLLKEKGFDIPCGQAYFNGSLVDYTMYGFCDGELLDCPSLSLALKWLREKGIIITVVYTRYSLQTIGTQLMFGFNIQNVHGESLFENVEVAYCSYEQAEMDAIKYSLENLI